MEIVGVIPARFASTRLPGKALLSETGRPLDPARARGGATGAIVTTDHRRDRRRADRRRPSTRCGGEFMMTRADHRDRHRPRRRSRRATRTGPIDRQPPGRRARDLRRRRSTASWRFWTNDPEAPMATLATPIRDESIYRDPACVKVVCARRGPCALLLAQPDPPSPRRPARSRARRAPDRPTFTWASTPIAATSCSSSARFPLRRSRPPRSSSSFACSTPDIRSPSASSTSRASASIRPRITGDSSRGGGEPELSGSQLRQSREIALLEPFLFMAYYLRGSLKKHRAWSHPGLAPNPGAYDAQKPLSGRLDRGHRVHSWCREREQSRAGPSGIDAERRSAGRRRICPGDFPQPGEDRMDYLVQIDVKRTHAERASPRRSGLPFRLPETWSTFTRLPDRRTVSRNDSLETIPPPSPSRSFRLSGLRFAPTWCPVPEVDG